MASRALSSISLVSFLLLSLISSVSAQTFTSCNPMTRTDCPTNPALGTNTTFNFTNGQMPSDKLWNITAGNIDWEDNGGAFIIHGSGDSPTIQSKFYLFFGVVSVFVQAAKGTGIVSSMVMESDDLDEVDWEFIGGNNTHVQTNYFGKGNTTTYDRAIWYPVDNPQDQYHNYTVYWTKDVIEWWVDNNKIRTLNYADANGGHNFPQTPMNLRIGIWAGGDVKKNEPGVVQWAGGATNFHQSPFTMRVAGVYAQDFSNGKEYKYGDQTGSWQGIQTIQGKSEALTVLTSPQGISGHWNALPKVWRIVIVASSVGVFSILLLALIIFCIKQRRAGRREHAALMEVEKKEQAELQEYKRQHAEEMYGQYGRRF